MRKRVTLRKHSVVETADQETVFTAGWWGERRWRGVRGGRIATNSESTQLLSVARPGDLLVIRLRPFYINKRVIYKYLCCEHFVIIYKTVFVLLRRFHETF